MNMTVDKETQAELDKGEIYRVAGIAQDITGRKRAEESLTSLRRELELTMESMEEGVHRVDLQGKIVFENQAAARMLGCEVADLIGRPAHQTMHHTRPNGTCYPEEQCPIYATFRDILAPAVRDQFDEYMTILRRDGATSGLMLVQTSSGERRVWEYYNSLRTEGIGTPIVRGMARDITDQRLAEKALRESEERYRELFENAHDAIYVHDLNGRYTSVNRAAENLSGYQREEIIGRHFSNFI